MKQTSTRFAIIAILISFSSLLFSQDPGVISSSQLICSGDTPSILDGTPGDPGGTGILIYQWMQTSANNPNMPVPGNNNGWEEITGATGEDYSPPALTVSTLYTRCVRRASQTNFLEANPILISLDDAPSGVSFTTPGPIIAGVPAVFNGTSNSPSTNTFEWDFDMDGDVDCIGQNCYNLYSTGGNTFLNLVVINNSGANCTYSMDSMVMVMAALPVELIAFEGYEEGPSIILKWRTDSESNNSHFVIEKSVDGIRFEVLGEIEGYGDGNSVVPQSYSYTDKNPINGINYYRLKQIDFDGNYEYFSVISVESTKEVKGTMVFPNPAKYKVTVQTEIELIGETIVEITDSYGQLVQNNIISSDKLNSFDVPVHQLQGGVYYLTIVSNNEKIYTKRIIVIN